MSTPLEVFGDIMGGYQQGKAAKTNAKLAEMNADTATDQAARDEATQRRERDLLTGSQFATAGASGVTADTFAPSIIQSAVQAELDALNARYRGAVQATGYRNEAKQLRLAGSQAIAGGYVKGAISYAKGVERAISAGAGGG